MRKSTAFTLVEMLLVVAVIVMLVSLLLPALTHARYSANLTRCAANLHNIAVGANTYALDNSSNYPRRSTVSTGGSKPGVIWLAAGSLDDRPAISKYIPINSCLNDPLAAEVNMENVFPTAAIETSYHLWFGFKYNGHRGLTKPTGNFTWQGNSFDILASDRDVVNWGGGTWVHGSHPDRGGIMYNEKLSMTNDSHFTGAQFVFSRWQSHTSYRRKPIDMNFARTDASVFRLSNLVTQDPRLIAVPEFASGANWPTAPTYLPAP